MVDIIKELEEEQMAKLTSAKEIPDFRPGDTIRVNVRITEGKNQRIQAFEGLCIARKNRGLNSSFVVRKISNGEGIERIFPLYAPVVEGITVVKFGIVRRAKLYYMRNLRGKAARIRERTEWMIKKK